MIIFPWLLLLPCDLFLALSCYCYFFLMFSSSFVTNSYFVNPTGFLVRELFILLVSVHFVVYFSVLLWCMLHDPTFFIACIILCLNDMGFLTMYIYETSLKLLWYVIFFSCFIKFFKTKWKKIRTLASIRPVKIQKEMK